MLRRSFLQGIIAAAASVGLPLSLERVVREPVRPSLRSEPAKAILATPDRKTRFTFAKSFSPVLDGNGSRMFSLIVCDDRGIPVGGRSGSLHWMAGERPNLQQDFVLNFIRYWKDKQC